MKEDSPQTNPESVHRPWWSKARWRWALAGFAIGVFDIVLARWLGFEFLVAGTDALPTVGLYLSVSFSIFGLLIGIAKESKQKEQAAHQKWRTQADELARVQARLAQAEKLASLGQLASTLAHEVRNPLAIMRSQIQNLSETLQNQEEGYRTCRTVMDEIDHLSRVTTSLVRFARPVPLHLVQTSAWRVVERVSLLAKPMTDEKSIRLKVRNPVDLVDQDFSADPDLICQVLIGLISNAIEATAPGGEILLRWDVSKRKVRFSVIDPGPGIPQDLHQQIFEPFFTTRSDGSGLGLAIARQIADAHGGSLEVRNRVDTERTGAHFELSIPVQESYP